MESMAASLFTGNMDWMSLAGKMLSNLKERPLKETMREPKKRKKTINIPPEAKPRPFRKPTHTGVYHGAFPVTKPSFAATASQFESLRLQLLRQLVVYQKQLMALRIPLIPEPFKTQNCVSNQNNLNYQMAAPYRNNHLLKDGKSMTVAENTTHKKNKIAKPKKLIKRKSKSKKASQSHDFNKEMNDCSSSQYFTRGVLPNNVHQFPYDKSGLNVNRVPTQCTYDSKAMCQKCIDSKNKTCIKKKAASKLSTKRRNARLQKQNHVVANKTCVLNDPKVLCTRNVSNYENIRD